MPDERPLGTRYETVPIPPVPEHTRWVDAGALRIGVEYRILNDEILTENFAADARQAAIIDAARPEMIDDRGVSLHVCDAQSGDEYLRFDLFESDPHYHYIHPGEYNVVINYDTNAFGEPVPWALDCLRSRLVAMLDFAGASDLAARVDQADVAAAIPKIVELATAGDTLLTAT